MLYIDAQVAEYIEATYEETTLRVVYINEDGADWIKEGLGYIPRRELYQAIHSKQKKRLIQIMERIEQVTENETKRKSVVEAKSYLLNQWKGIMVRIKNPEVVGCSAEGHISPTFLARMSSRPMGWSELGANQMCKLRCYKENRDDIIELVQMQKELKATGTEDAIGNQTLRELFGKLASKTYKKEDYYINGIQASIPGYSTMKQISISTHLSNL